MRGGAHPCRRKIWAGSFEGLNDCVQIWGYQSLPVVIIEHATGDALANYVRMPIQQLKAKRFLEYGLFEFSLSLKRHLLSCPDGA